jgi:glucose-1-phosphate cytidylyltransferase
MRYYAHFGHKDFILCLGYRGDLIRDYFLNYQETMTNDFTLSGINSARQIEVHQRDTEGWKITFVDTGLHSNIGQRLLRAKKYLADESLFLANYADGLSDLPLDLQLQDFAKRDAMASFASVRSAQSFHAVQANDKGVVTHIGAMPDEQMWINGGYFVLRQGIFDYINEGDELVLQPFERLIQAGKLATFRWEGFWECMDTFKDKISFDRMEAQGECPWMVWRRHPAAATGR